MRNLKRNILQLISILTFASALSILPSTLVYADLICLCDESEGPRTDLDSAPLIELNESVSGCLETNEDVDVYCFVSEMSGYITVTVETPNYPTRNYPFDGCVYLKLFKDSQGLESYEDFWPNGEEHTLLASYIEPRKPYLLEIHSNQSEAVLYTLIVNFSEITENVECEDNNSIELANYISLGEVCFGSLCKNDIDCYELIIDEEGYLNISVHCGLFYNQYLYKKNEDSSISLVQERLRDSIDKPEDSGLIFLDPGII